MIQKYVQSIQKKIETTRQKRRNNRQMSLTLGKQLVKGTNSEFEALASQLSDKHSDFKRIADILANEIMQCGIDHFKANMNGGENPRAGALELLRSAGQIAISIAIKQRVDDNLQGVEDWAMMQELKEENAAIYDFNKIKLQTAFSFMTCDGDIDQNEVALIRNMAVETNLFGQVDIDTELDFLIEIINKKGTGYLKDYFKVIKNAKLDHDQEVQLVDIAVKTLMADAVIDYNELRFFRIFRTQLEVSDEKIFDRVPGIPDEFMETDIFTNAYVQSLFDDYFDHVKIPKFEKIDIDRAVKYINPIDYQK